MVRTLVIPMAAGRYPPAMNDAPAVQKSRGSFITTRHPPLLLFGPLSQSPPDFHSLRRITREAASPFAFSPAAIYNTSILLAPVISRTQLPAAHRSWIHTVRQLDESIDTSPAAPPLHLHADEARSHSPQ